MDRPWVKTVAEAKIIQSELRQQVIKSDCLGEIKHVAGVDIGYLIQENNNKQQQQRSLFLRDVNITCYKN